MTQRAELQLATLAAQAAGLADDPSGAAVPPLYLATTYARDAEYGLRGPDRFYARYGTPTITAAERVIAALEGADRALLFASGMAGVAALFRALSAGASVAVPSRGYYGVVAMAERLAARGEIRLALYDPRVQEPQSVLTAGETKLLWVETPANPTWEIVDIAAAARAARAAGALLAVDSTVATPVHTRPLALGADIVFHAATKALNGHSDVLAGALAFAPGAGALAASVLAERSLSGAVPGGFEAWLLIRGLRTLDVRVRRASASAAAIAAALHGHPNVAAVLYPGLPQHPGHAVAERQMQGGFGAMLSLRVAGGAEAALDVVRALRLFRPATSLGGVESLIEHRASVEGPRSDVPGDLLRLSIGLEDPGDLIADLVQALA